MEREPQTEPIDPAAETIAAAAESARDGVQSYSHGSRQVTRQNPRTQLEFVQDWELRQQRRQRGICVPC